jgi:flagellar L-ring protein FlgH
VSTTSFLIGVLSCSLVACGTVRGDDDVFPEDSAAQIVAPVAPSNGAIYQAGREIALFENTVARRVGDVLVVRLVENTSASKSSSTSTRKSTAAELPGPTIAGRPVTVNGTAILDAGIENESTFDGEGTSSQSNRLSGDLAVIVVGHLGNGTLRVRGEKWVTINQGREFVRLEGLVRAIDVLPDNTVPSTRVANARISYAGKGALADANAPGWLARFFNSPKLPF